jgi:hypothetical protein
MLASILPKSWVRGVWTSSEEGSGPAGCTKLTHMSTWHCPRSCHECAPVDGESTAKRLAATHNGMLGCVTRVVLCVLLVAAQWPPCHSVAKPGLAVKRCCWPQAWMDLHTLCTTVSLRDLSMICSLSHRAAHLCATLSRLLFHAHTQKAQPWLPSNAEHACLSHKAAALSCNTAPTHRWLLHTEHARCGPRHSNHVQCSTA